jgi:hypothetical protein
MIVIPGGKSDLAGDHELSDVSSCNHLQTFPRFQQCSRPHVISAHLVVMSGSSSSRSPQLSCMKLYMAIALSATPGEISLLGACSE